MPNPCPNCAKMVALEFQDPEEESLELDVESRKVTGQVRIVRQCADCGTDMKEATLDLEVEIPKCCGKGLEDEVELVLNRLEEGGSRYQKSYFGAEGEIKAKCKCGQPLAVQWSDKVAASEMEECS